MHKQMKAVQVPGHLALIESVAGLDSTRRARHHHVVKAAGKTRSVGGIDPATIKTAYGFDSLYSSGLNGSGQHIAVATYNGFTAANVQSYYQQNNVSPMSTVDQVAFNGAAAYDADSAGETELDSEFSGMIAPGVAVHVFASATNDDAGELALFTAILDDNRAKIVNYSWGSCEPQVTAQHQSDMTTVMARAVAQGVNITVASGDSGSDSCGDNTNKADWPAASPYVIAVGGTSFSFDGTTLSETGWNGSGGGISALWNLPTWQQNLGSPYTKRSYPDVAFNADPNTGEAIYTGQPAQWQVIGGTSMAAPQWAGFLALLANARQKAGKSDIGFLSPFFYAMSSSTYASTMNDVTSGNNGLYNAGTGWDAVTGWGSMQASALLAYLKNQ